MRALLLGAVAALAGLAQGQQASYTYFGSACNAPQNFPHLTATSLPTLGGTLTVNVTSGWTGVPESQGTSYLLTGVSNTQWSGLSLPIHLTVPGWGPSCGLLLTSVELPLQIPHRFSINPQIVPMSFRIPETPSLLGVSLYQQVLVFSSGCCPAPGSRAMLLSRGGHALIGL